MRIYIIGNDGVTLCREPPTTVKKGEITVASREDLHTARLSGKRLLARWNALPGVEKQAKVGDRNTLIDQLWSAIEALPDPDQEPNAKRPSKQDAVIARNGPLLPHSSHCQTRREVLYQINLATALG
jgi:hypothetical protein